MRDKLLQYCIIWLFLIAYGLSETAVLLLARGGSKGVRLKNLQKVGNSSLLYRSINCARLAGFNDITVSTDHPYIALEALKCGVDIFHRCRITAKDWAPSIWGAAEFLKHRPDIKVLVLLQLTSPFLTHQNLKRAVEKLNYPIPRDCVFSVTRSFKLRWTEDTNNNNVFPLNFNLHSRPRRQDMKGELLETGAFYITKRKLIEMGDFQNEKECIPDVYQLVSRRPDQLTIRTIIAYLLQPIIKEQPVKIAFSERPNFSSCAVQILDSRESLEIDSYYDLEVANAILASNLF